jgi:hypothetical protein
VKITTRVSMPMPADALSRLEGHIRHTTVERNARRTIENEPALDGIADVASSRGSSLNPPRTVRRESL